MRDGPLRIDWVDGALCDDQLPGRLGMTILPGKRGPSSRYPGRVYRRDLATDLAALRAADVRRLVLLVEDRELERWGDPGIARRAGSAGVEVVRHPMSDGGVPGSIGEMQRIIDEIEETRHTANVAVACMGGVGRTGTVAACALVAAGMDAVEAIRHIRAVRHPEAVETAAQEAFVAAYRRHLEAVAAN